VPVRIALAGKFGLENTNYQIELSVRNACMAPLPADGVSAFLSAPPFLNKRVSSSRTLSQGRTRRCCSSQRRVVTPMAMALATSHGNEPLLETIPVVMCDILDTLVADPFTRGMAEHLGFDNFNDFLDAKTPDVWNLFELGRISEEQLARQFFKDKNRKLDVTAMKIFLLESYTFNPGVEEMLAFLRNSGVKMHAFSNYPIWFTLIEQSLKLEREHGMRWTFVSACEGLRKPSLDAFKRAADNAYVSVSDCILLDDRQVNCEAALEAGYLHAIRFQSAAQAELELRNALQPYFSRAVEHRK
jgi:FMN hydrolase / 5-amino-6-(5-phospho-D-ribitylamino)uracil phosphatase